jgi:hypothetical protein
VIDQKILLAWGFTMLLGSRRRADSFRSGIMMFVAALLPSLCAGVTSPSFAQSGSPWRASAEIVSAGGLDPRDWKAVLVSGSRSSSAYDAAAFDLAQRLRVRGVARVATALTGDVGDFGASRAGIRQAMEWLGNETGACLFFATGHSNIDGFHLDADGRRRTLRPGELDSMLDKHCGDRPTVVIISGCDAATFLSSSMRQPNRILIAASAKGRDSYGARMSDRYVNFDRCLIGAIDAGAATWREAFQRALPCVQEREAWLGVRPSDPQAYFGAAVADLAIPGATRFTAQMR